MGVRVCSHACVFVIVFATQTNIKQQWRGERVRGWWVGGWGGGRRQADNDRQIDSCIERSLFSLILLVLFCMIIL